jgi:hypothetical protein
MGRKWGEKGGEKASKRGEKGGAMGAKRRRFLIAPKLATSGIKSSYAIQSP